MLNQTSFKKKHITKKSNLCDTKKKRLIQINGFLNVVVDEYQTGEGQCSLAVLRELELWFELKQVRCLMK